MFDGDMRRFVNETLVSKQHYLRNFKYISSARCRVLDRFELLEWWLLWLSLPLDTYSLSSGNVVRYLQTKDTGILPGKGHSIYVLDAGGGGGGSDVQETVANIPFSTLMRDLFSLCSLCMIRGGYEQM